MKLVTWTVEDAGPYSGRALALCYNNKPHVCAHTPKKALWQAKSTPHSWFNLCNGEALRSLNKNFKKFFQKGENDNEKNA
jgi:hypothetical protein